jgi:4-diphosphocytidyl-2-C-methyl-D-erythritol kinase
VDALTLFCPAKINLFLAITGRRSDGFHSLVSVAAPVDWGDMLTVQPTGAGEFDLTCSDAAVPTDESNLVLKAARAFVAASGWRGGARFHLEKRVPMGSGLGGGSSDAVGALKALNQLAGNPLDSGALSAVAAQVGSDCPLFLSAGAVIMRGRGEMIEPVPVGVNQRLAAARLLLVKPAFGVNTGWAYGALAAQAPGGYLAEAEAETRLEAWLGDESAGVDQLGFNSMAAPVWAKHIALPTLARGLQRELGLTLAMSGSGSACYVVLGEAEQREAVRQSVWECWGESALVREVTLRVGSREI